MKILLRLVFVLLLLVLVGTNIKTLSSMKENKKSGMQALLAIDPGDTDALNVIVEIPKGSLNKYEYDAKLRVMTLDRVIGADLRYPVEYGFIPQTVMPDGDPLDFIMLVTEPTYPGVLIEARPIGIMQMLDGEDVDDKILTVPVKDPRFASYEDLSDVPNTTLIQIETFFSIYKNSEGKTTSVPGWKDHEAAYQLIQEALEAYKAD